MAWKTIKDYLENEGVVLEKITPKAVIVAALEARIIIRKEDWMRALDDRNRMSHVYSKIVFAEIVNNIEQGYLSLFDQLYEKLLTEAVDKGK